MSAVSGRQAQCLPDEPSFLSPSGQFLPDMPAGRREGTLHLSLRPRS